MVVNKMNGPRSVLLPGDTKIKQLRKLKILLLIVDGICAAQMK